MFVLKVNVFLFTVAFMLSSGRHQVSSKSSKTILSDLPFNAVTNILTILINGNFKTQRDYSNNINASSVQFWLFTRQNPNDAKILKSTSELNINKPIKLLIHGWRGNAVVNYINVIKNAYLKRYDCNVISVDYSEYAATDYITAYRNVLAVGIAVADFICNMSSTLSPESLHVVGHSLGAQVGGIAGYQVQQKCQATIGRITGLDPAGPFFQNKEKPHRLDSEDALLVDVIHTNQGQFGYIGKCGTVDFYPNCGNDQPNCLVMRTLNDEIALADIFELPLEHVFCSHQRSCYLFAESINNNTFFSTTCLLCTYPTCLMEGINEMYYDSHAYMGESCRYTPKDPEYILYTNGEPPYGRGPQGLLH